MESYYFWLMGKCCNMSVNSTQMGNIKFLKEFISCSTNSNMWIYTPVYLTTMHSLLLVLGPVVSHFTNLWATPVYENIPWGPRVEA